MNPYEALRRLEARGGWDEADLNDFAIVHNALSGAGVDAPYEITNPKHPRHHEVMADASDLRERCIP